MDHKEKIFVYATLLNPIVRAVVCLENIKGISTQLEGYKRIKRNVVVDKSSKVVGELIEVTKAQLLRLDLYERVPKRYKRIKVMVRDEPVWIYHRSE